MIEVRVDIEVMRAPGEVFDFISDWTNNPRWQLGMKRCTWTSEPPLRLGSTYDQEAEFLGRPIVSSFEVVEYDPGRQIRIRTTESTIPLDITRRVEPGPNDATVVSALIRGGPAGVMALFDPLTRRLVRRNVARDYARLQVLLDGDAAET